MQCMSQLSESTCPQLQHQGTKATNWSKGAMLGKKKFYFLKKMGRSGDRKQDFFLLRPKKTIAFAHAQEDYCFTSVSLPKVSLWLTLGKQKTNVNYLKSFQLSFEIMLYKRRYG